MVVSTSGKIFALAIQLFHFIQRVIYSRFAENIVIEHKFHVRLNMTVKSPLKDSFKKSGLSIQLFVLSLSSYCNRGSFINEGYLIECKNIPVC